MAKTLDKSRDYGEILNDSEGRRYMQDGCYFNAHGQQIGLAEPAKTTSKPAAKKPATAAAGDDQLTAQMGA